MESDFGDLNEKEVRPELDLSQDISPEDELAEIEAEIEAEGTDEPEAMEESEIGEAETEEVEADPVVDEEDVVETMSDVSSRMACRIAST